MFRKYYKEANNDIKPDEEFINSVIKNAHKRKPPVRRQYIKYAAPAAAAVVIVSAAVISMPVWKSVTDNSDGLIIEERVTHTAPPQSDKTQNSPKPNAFPENNPQSNAAANPPENNSESTSVNSWTDNPKSAAKFSENSSKAGADMSAQEITSQHSYSDYENSNNLFSKSIAAKSSEVYIPPEKNEENTANPVQDMGADETEENAAVDGAQTQSDSVDFKNELVQQVGDSSDYEPPPERTMPPALENAEPPVYSAAMAESAALYDEPNLPTPEGYHCVSAAWNGYTFASDDGAVIDVEISYGGEEDSEPYYSVDGDNIFATFTAYGMTVTVSATGADLSTVEEIIDSLR